MQDSAFHSLLMEFNKPYDAMLRQESTISRQISRNANCKLLAILYKARCNGFHSESAAALNNIRCQKRNVFSLNFVKFRFQPRIFVN